VNVPLGLFALGLLLRGYRPAALPTRHTRIDYAGALVLVGGVVPLLLALSIGGHELAWTSPVLLGLLAASAALLTLLVRVETRAPEPILPLALVRSRAVGIPTLGMLFLSGGIFATALSTPLFVQGVIGSSATSSGGVLAPMMLAFVAASVLLGQLIARVPRYRAVGVLGLLGAAAGAWLMAGMGIDTDYATVARNLVVVGFGLGGALAAFAITTQNAVPIAQMGVATALGTSGRAMGSTVASAAFGSLLAARLGTQALTPAVLAAALHDTFTAAGIVLCIGAMLAILVKEAPPRRSQPRDAPSAHAADHGVMTISPG
jgi:hypothetical protein